MSIQPAKLNIKVQRRSTFNYFVELADENDNPIDLTGARIYSQIWDKGRVNKFVDFTIEYINRSLGQFNWILSAVNSAALPCECFYDLVVVDSTFRPFYLLEGMVFVSEGYTSDCFNNLGVCGFSPSSIETFAWFDAADASTVVLSNGRVPAWVDKSGTGRILITSSTGESFRPTYSGGSIQFDGGNFLFTSISSLPAYWEWFLVAKFDKTDVFQVLVRDNWISGVGTGIDAYSSSSGNFYKIKNTGNSAYQTSIDDEFGTNRFIHGYSMRDNDTAYSFVNGVEKTSWAASGAIGSQLVLGINPLTLSSGFFGSVSEFIILPYQASDTLRQKIEGYLAHKWNIADSLPILHPYKAAAPSS